MRRLAAALVLGLATGPALAHPHVAVTASSVVVYDGEKRVTGVRHDWVFDDVFSAFASQGLDTDGDGKLSREELQPLAQTNVESLREFGYFTFAKLGGTQLLFKEPVDYWLDYNGTNLTLHFFLPLSTPQPQGRKALAVQVYDPSYYVAFGMADKDPARMEHAPDGCALDLIRPKALDDAQLGDAAKLDQEEFRLLDANKSFGAQFANNILVNCP